MQKSTIKEQVAAHMREKILKGDWQEYLPGRDRLAEEFGVSHMTVLRAVEQLEQEGLLLNQGNGKRRRIVRSASQQSSRSLRVAVLRHSVHNTEAFYVVDFVHKLREAGHQAVYADKTQIGLNKDVKRIARLVQKTEADAWIVIGGSREILEWFAAQQQPCFGLFGRFSDLPIAGSGPSKKVAYSKALQRLVDLGHSRIVMLAQWVDKESIMHAFFRQELEARGVVVGDYHLPKFGNDPEELQQLLNSLFATTPPTAIVAATIELFLTVQQFLVHRGIRVPEDVSLICGDPDPNFGWCRPTIAHLSWDSAPWVRRIVRWAGNIASGKQDHRQSINEANFVDGGTLDSPPKQG